MLNLLFSFSSHTQQVEKIIRKAGITKHTGIISSKLFKQKTVVHSLFYGSPGRGTVCQENNMKSILDYPCSHTELFQMTDITVNWNAINIPRHETIKLCEVKN